MEFNFENDINIETTADPSVKPLNNIIVPNKNISAGLWISNENAKICKWKKNSDGEYLNTIPYIIKFGKENEKIISGRVLVDPGMLILQRSPLLKIETKSGRIFRQWIAKESKEGGLYSCVRKYMVMFVDSNNNPLHEIPLQLTAKGCFQFEFDKQLWSFRKEMIKVYNRDLKKNATAMKNYWYSMCVFAPRFQSMMRGEGSKQDKACITTEYEYPNSFLHLFVGKRNDLANKFWPAAPESSTYAQYIYQLYWVTKKSCELKGWWRKQ